MAMRIAYLVNQYPKISHTFIRREILALERLGIEVMRISLRGWEQELVDGEDQLERERTRYVLRDGAPVLIFALMRMLLTQPVHLMRALKLVWRVGRGADRPLPVHLAYLAEACRIVPWLRQADIQHLHAHFSSNSAEVAMLVHALGGPKWSFTAHGAASLENPNFTGLSEKARQCAFIVVVCSFARAQLFRFMDRRHWPKVRVVHCGLEANYTGTTLSSVPAARRLVCVGRLCAEKAHFLLLEAAQRLAAQGTDFELVLAGDGELRSDIEALIARHNLRARVRITGWISAEQVRNEILAARALVLPSLIEGLPLVIMEAMALRRPVISTFVAGIPELVIPGEHGWLVPASDVEALARAMQTCLDMPVETLARMGESAWKRVHARHDIDTEAGKLVKLFEATIEGKTASSFVSAAA
jgi:colanic acid/amylovoran biosynthesis glycosyltransferase